MTTMSAAFLSDPAERLRASVVRIANGRKGRRAAGGAAIAWSGDLFVTSAHVVTASHATIVTPDGRAVPGEVVRRDAERSEEHTSELQSLAYLVCRLLLEKKKKNKNDSHNCDSHLLTV